MRGERTIRLDCSIEFSGQGIGTHAGPPAGVPTIHQPFRIRPHQEVMAGLSVRMRLEHVGKLRQTELTAFPFGSPRRKLPLRSWQRGGFALQ